MSTERDELACKVRWASKKSTTAEQARDIADALIKAGYGKFDAVLAIVVRLEASNQCEDHEIADDIRAAINDALGGPVKHEHEQ